MHRISLIVLELIVVQVIASSKRVIGDNLNLVMVIECIRHGIRAPLSAKYDASWQNELGELIPQGYRQAYVLGKAIAYTYPSLVKSYNPANIYVRATQLNRTIQTAVAHMTGMLGFGYGPSLTEAQIGLATPPYHYPQNLTQNLTNASLPFNWQPIPIHSVLIQDDYLLYAYNSAVCPNSNNFQQNQYSTDTYAQFTATMNSTIQTFNELTGKYFDFSNITSAFETLTTDYYANKSFPSAYSKILPFSQLWQNLTFIHDFIEFFKNFGTTQQVQLFSFYPLNQILQYMNGYVNGSNPNLNYVLLSGSDTFLMPILSALNIASHSCLYDNFFNITNQTNCKYPIFASSLNFELYQDTTDGSYAVQVVYDGVPIPYCNGQDTICDFNLFTNNINTFIGDMTLQKFFEICGVQSAIVQDNVTFWTTLAYVFGGFVLLFAVGIGIVLYHKKKEIVKIRKRMYLFSHITEITDD